MRNPLLTLIILAVLFPTAWALDADSLGSNPWTSYLRSDVADTILGELWFSGAPFAAENPNFVYPLCWNLVTGKLEYSQYTILNTPVVGTGRAESLTVGGVAHPGASFLRSDVRDTLSASLIFRGAGRLHGVSDSAGQAAIEIFLADDRAKAIHLSAGNLDPSSQASLLFITGNGKNNNDGTYTDLTRYGELGHNVHGQGFYIGNNSWGTYYDITAAAVGAYFESNFASVSSSVGAYFMQDYAGGGRGIPIKGYMQGNASYPFAIITGDGGSYTDSAFIYRWGVLADSFRARKGFYGVKAEVETVKTALCGRRLFSNGGLNLCDTIIVPGVVGSTTVVTVSYGRDTLASSWNGLQAWAGKDTIYVQRRALTDPGCYYWRAEKVVDPAQIQPEVPPSGMEFPPEIPTPPAPDVKLMQSYPNPAARKATISYQTARAGKVSLAVYNMLGQKVKVLVEQPQPAGSYKVQWDGRNQQGHGVSSGVYIYELKTEETNITKKLVLTR